MIKIKQKTIVWLVACLMSAGVSVAIAATDNSQGVIKILSVQEAILNTEAAQAQLKAFQEQPEIVDYLKQLDALKKEHDAAVAELQKESAIMSAEQQQVAAQAIQDKRADSEYIGRKLQAAQQAVIQSIMQAIQPDVQQVVQGLITSENIGLLLDAGAALHADSAFNITSKVTDELNKMSRR